MKLCLKNDSSSLDIIFEAIVNFCSENSLSEDIKHNLNIIVDEIVSNVINYSNSAMHNDKFYVSFQMIKDDVEIEIIDFGEKFNPLLRETPDTESSLEDRCIGGLGIFLVKQFSKDLRYQRIEDKNILTIVLSIE